MSNTVTALLVVGVSLSCIVLLILKSRSEGDTEVKHAAEGNAPVEKEELLARFKSDVRSTWLPKVREGDGALTDCKFSGIPWLSESEGWPVCPNCKKAMQLFVQLNLSQLPSRPDYSPDKGLVQLFYCTSSEPCCEIDCEAYSPRSKSVVARLIQVTGAPNSITVSPVADAFPAKTITGWEKADDYPDYNDMIECGIKLNDEEWDTFDELDIFVEGEKLLGWPLWVQGAEYPLCPRCSAKMEFFFQIDSEVNIPYMFGDAGRGHITQCPKHPDQLAFGWACY